MKHEKCTYCIEYGNLPCEKCDKFDKTKVYIDLSKLSKNKIRKVVNIITKSSELSHQFNDDIQLISKTYPILSKEVNNKFWDLYDVTPKNKTEINFSEFKKLFSVEKDPLNKDKKEILDMLKYTLNLLQSTTEYEVVESFKHDVIAIKYLIDKHDNSKKYEQQN